MTFFKIIWSLDAIVAVVVLYFFFVGVADGTVSSRNAGLWFFVVAALAGILCGSIWLNNYGQRGSANALLLVMAIPAFLFVLYFGIAIATKARWN